MNYMSFWREGGRLLFSRQFYKIAFFHIVRSCVRLCSELSLILNLSLGACMFILPKAARVYMHMPLIMGMIFLFTFFIRAHLFVITSKQYGRLLFQLSRFLLCMAPLLLLSFLSLMYTSSYYVNFGVSCILSLFSPIVALFVCDDQIMRPTYSPILLGGSIMRFFCAVFPFIMVPACLVSLVIQWFLLSTPVFMRLFSGVCLLISLSMYVALIVLLYNKYVYEHFAFFYPERTLSVEE